MTSSTSPSDAARPGTAARLLVAALLAWAVGAAYTLRMNPETAFYRRGHELKREWLATMPATNRILLVGGSSCSTSVDPVRMRDAHGLNVVNLGLGAGMGPRVLGRYALDATRPGDRLVLSVEQGLLARPFGWELMGLQFLGAAGLPDLAGEPAVPGAVRTALALRPGARILFAALVKAGTRRPAYRYGVEEWRPGGWWRAAPRLKIADPGALPTVLSADGREWLATMRDECRRRGVEVVYAIPWQYGDAAKAEEWRAMNARFLAEVARHVPVLADPEVGVHTEAAHFADTAAHPTAEGAALRTDRLAAMLARWPAATPR